MAGPNPLHRPLIPVTIPCTTPWRSASEWMETNAEIAGYVMEDTLASIPAAHIIHVLVPKPYLTQQLINFHQRHKKAQYTQKLTTTNPNHRTIQTRKNTYHSNCSISKSSPSMMVCLHPRDLMSIPRQSWDITDSSPTSPMKTATIGADQPITNLRYTKMQEYCPASGKYDRKTVMHSSRIVGSLPTLRSEENGSACSQLIGEPQELGRTLRAKSYSLLLIVNNVLLRYKEKYCF